MASRNLCIFIGNLGRDPEIKYMKNGDAVANVSLACTEKWKDKNSGDWKEATEWVRLVMFRNHAEFAEKYLHKGSQVYVESKLRQRKYTDKDGVEKYSTEFNVDTILVLGPKQDGRVDDEGGYDRPRQRGPEERKASQEDRIPKDAGFDDLPF